MKLLLRPNHPSRIISLSYVDIINLQVQTWNSWRSVSIFSSIFYLSLQNGRYNMYKTVHARPAYARAVALKDLLSLASRDLITYHLIVQLLQFRELNVSSRPPLGRDPALFSIASCAPRGCAASSRKSMKRQTPRGPATPRVLSDGVGPCVRAGFIVSSRNLLSRVSLCNPVEIE